MSEVIIVKTLPASFVASIMESADFHSPLRCVASHVATSAIERAYALATDEGALARSSAVIFEAEKEIVQQYVREDFCGLCGRFTDHRGEH